MNKLLLFFIGVFILIIGCMSSVVVEDYQADFEKQKSIYDLDYHTGERTPIQLANISITKEILNDYPGLADKSCLLYTSPSPRDRQKSRMPSSA